MTFDIALVTYTTYITGQYHVCHAWYPAKTEKFFIFQMFHEMDLETKKKFLIFLTGSDRIPIHGIHSIKIIIQKVKDNSRYDENAF